MAKSNPRERARRAASADSCLRAVYKTGQPADRSDLIAIDPGDQHVGVAFFAQASPGLWYCQDAQQIDDPDGFEDALASTLLEDPGYGVALIYERYRLYEDKARQQKGSEFRTSQMIGVIQFLARQRNQHVERHTLASQESRLMTCELDGGMCSMLTAGPAPITIVGQMADIQKPTAGILRFKKIKSIGRQLKKENPGWGDHVISAELHGWKYILDELGHESAPGF